MALAAVAAGAWGCSDFLAGWCARRFPVRTVLVGSKVTGLVLGLLVLLAVGFTADRRLLLITAVAGVLGLPAMGLLYLAMRDGSLAVVAPVAAGAALVPVAWGLTHGEHLGPGGAVGALAALAGITLASWPVTPADPAPTPHHPAPLPAPSPHPLAAPPLHTLPAPSLHALPAPSPHTLPAPSLHALPAPSLRALPAGPLRSPAAARLALPSRLSLRALPAGPLRSPAAARLGLLPAESHGLSRAESRGSLPGASAHVMSAGSLRSPAAARLGSPRAESRGWLPGASARVLSVVSPRPAGAARLPVPSVLRSASLSVARKGMPSAPVVRQGPPSASVVRLGPPSASVVRQGPPSASVVRQGPPSTGVPPQAIVVESGVGAREACGQPAGVDKRRRGSAVWYASGAAMGFGTYFVLLHEASVEDPYVATAYCRVFGGLAALVLAFFWRPSGPSRWAEPLGGRLRRWGPRGWGLRSWGLRRWGPRSWGLPAVSIPIAVGALESVADGAFALAASVGALGAAAVLASLYPAVTVLLNTSVLRERLPAVHLCGVLSALLGVACLAA
ncbi:hypothetical protein [Actinoplanes sp. L3-i22]|uniref:hypothetical protein n=1 Tax=Actinoplanes sp. L3-i22 TaxID=2836373 RepID=UPI001C7994E1|nr:hypothetical protein [Actinoplanes sp. L3-i22]BCY12770.1 hypothetical protein L3i22_078580 [Actinoplanes sp. L3-i22]